MKEIVVISGKGGTGKTSITASFASFTSKKAVLADCDVDAADLHLILKPDIKNRYDFKSGHIAQINADKCTGCGKCMELCRYEAVHEDDSRGNNNSHPVFSIDHISCEGCGVCVHFCPESAIDFPEEICGEWFNSQTRFGPMVHAKLGIAAENSGKLVTLVRNEGKKIAQNQNLEYLIIDGSPGIGCPVIASLTAADLALIVTEPTVSGIHDTKRIAGLTKRLNIKALICVNKWDINPEASDAIREFSESAQIPFAGLVRYDKVFTNAQRQELSIPEFDDGPVTDDIRKVWESVLKNL
ncbi:MAG: 4Fe-4S binding protein [Fibrobacter sp.]|nr:4Fe-4S binding protein [Fibrobacter sp.]